MHAPKIHYFLIAKDDVVLADYSNSYGNFKSFTKEMLPHVKIGKFILFYRKYFPLLIKTVFSMLVSRKRI